MKKKDILNSFALINEAKLTKLEDETKFKIIKACRAMRPIVDDLKKFEEDARKKLAAENHDEIIEKAQKWQEEKENTTLSTEDRIQINNYLIQYSANVSKCLSDELESEIDITYEKLNEDELKKFVASNDWNVQQVVAVITVLE